MELFCVCRVRVTLDKHFGSVNIVKAVPVDPHNNQRDGPSFVSAARDGMINMWTAEGDCLLSQGAHRHAVNCLSEFQSYDNNIDPSVCSNPSFISSGGDNVVKIWDSRRLKVTSSFNASNVVKTAWFHHGIITGFSSGSICCWDLQTTGGEAAEEADLPRTWTSRVLGTHSHAVTDIVSDKGCVASSSKSGQILRWQAR